MHPAQAAFHRSDAPFRGYCGGIGSGKSWAGAYDLVRRAARGRLYLAVAPTFPMMRDATLRSFTEVATGLHFLAAINRSEMLARLGNGAEVLFRSADDPERMRGPNLSGIWLDEASLMAREAFDIGIGRLRQGGERGWLSATFTPRGRSHWTFDVFGTGRPDTALFVSRTRDNPFLPPTFTEAVARQYGPTLAAQELEGAFIDPAGSMFKREWLARTAVAAPPGCRRVRRWDKGYAAGGDYSAGVLMARDPQGRYYVEDVVRGRWEAHERNQVIVATAAADRARHGAPVRQVVEQEPGAGKESTAYILRLLAGYPCEAELVHRNKAERAEPFASQCAAGNVFLVEAHWNRDFVGELCAFPEGAHDDQVDGASGAFLWLARPDPGRPAAAGGRPAPAGSPYRGAGAYGPRGGAGYGPRG